MTTRTLYRPVGLRELELVLDADARAFPPRLPAQPIFYPVMNADYAAQIAREWNPTDVASGFAGFVTEFDVDADYLSRFEVKTVGATRHQELWVPAEGLDAFNGHIRSRVRTTSAFYGPAYEGRRAAPAPREVARPARAAQGPARGPRLQRDGLRHGGRRQLEARRRELRVLVRDGAR